MKSSLPKILVVLTLLLPLINNGQQTTSEKSEIILSGEDLVVLLGEWEGSLTYMDYSSNKPYSMPANVSVTPGKNINQLSLYFTYPKEPKANSKDNISITKDGKALNKKALKSNQTMPDGQVLITTDYIGKDNNKKTNIRNLYSIGKEQFVIGKEVKFGNTDKWLKRNEYSFIRKGDSNN
ncbi:MAG: hypothetical protein OEQ81_09080 [Flavobacteriaceae bacterium]|nr:hypothetical protein [Flavobacteriaceae bacterium]